MLKIYEKAVIIIVVIIFIITFLLIYTEYYSFIAYKAKTTNEYTQFTETEGFDSSKYGNNCNSSNDINTPEECQKYWSSQNMIPTNIRKGTDNTEYITKIYDTSTSPTPNLKTNAGIYGQYRGSSLNAETPETSYRTNLPNFTAIYDTMTSCTNACSSLLTKSSCELYDGSPNSPIIQCGDTFNPHEKNRMKCRYNTKTEICEYARF